MLSTGERQRRRGRGAKLAPEALGKYSELYRDFCANGYTKSLADSYADFFVDEAKRPSAEDIIQTARLYEMAHETKLALFYLEKLDDTKKLGGDDRFDYCVEALKIRSKLGSWREAEEFRTENIDFMQKHSMKVSGERMADMYIALAYVDCAAKKYAQAFRLLMNFGYKPRGKNDETLLEILITGVYICACSGDEASLQNAVDNARAGLKLFDSFKFDWTKKYYEKRIEDAANGVI